MCGRKGADTPTGFGGESFLFIIGGGCDDNSVSVFVVGLSCNLIKLISFVSRFVDFFEFLNTGMTSEIFGTGNSPSPRTYVENVVKDVR